MFEIDINALIIIGFFVVLLLYAFGSLAVDRVRRARAIKTVRDRVSDRVCDYLDTLDNYKSRTIDFETVRLWFCEERRAEQGKYKQYLPLFCGGKECYKQVALALYEGHIKQEKNDAARMRLFDLSRETPREKNISRNKGHVVEVPLMIYGQ